MNLIGPAAKWPTEHEQTLEALAEIGLSGGEIGRKIGRTRSAVCGKAARLGISLKGSQADRGIIEAVEAKRERATMSALPKVAKALDGQQGGYRVQPGSNVQALAAKAAFEKQKRAAVLPKAELASGSNPKYLKDHQGAWECIFPTGEVREGNGEFHKICCAPIMFGRTYCDEHRRIAYRTDEPLTDASLRKLMRAFR